MSLTAERLDRIQPSLTIAISTVARKMIADGKNVISLSQGEPDFDTPANIKEAAIKAIEGGQTKYTDVSGTPALRKAAAEKLRRDSGLDYKPEEIIVSTGAKQVLFNAMVATLNAGDEVIIPSPCWVTYPDIVTLSDGKPVLIPCAQNNGFKLRAEDLEAAITPKTRWFMLNNPCNPTGAAYTAEELKPICEVLMRHPHVWVLTDDIYDGLVYDGFKAGTIVAVEPRLKDRTLTVHGVSKSYAMTGWRIGIGAGPVPLIKSTSNPSTIAMAAAVEAFIGPQDTVESMRKVFEERRNLVVGMLNQAKGIHCSNPDGAFYVYPSVQGCIGKTSKGGKLIKDDEAFALALLDEEGVATVHGAAFCFPGYIRISYANSNAELIEAMTRIQRFCDGLS
jgi:aspartate aminotransferase